MVYVRIELRKRDPPLIVVENDWLIPLVEYELILHPPEAVDSTDKPMTKDNAV